MITWARIVSPALAILLASVGLFGLVLSGRQIAPEEAEEGSATDMTETIAATMPSPEVAAPQETETATFALG